MGYYYNIFFKKRKGRGDLIRALKELLGYIQQPNQWTNLSPREAITSQKEIAANKRSGMRCWIIRSLAAAISQISNSFFISGLSKRQ